MTQTTRRTALAGMLLLLVTASGCGTLPTQPNTNDATLRPEASARVGQLEAREPSMELGDSGGQTGGVVPTPPVAAPEIFVPTPGLGGGQLGNAWGHRNKKPKK